MSILAVAAVSSTSAAIAAAIALRSVRNGTASRRDLWLVAATALFLAVVLSVYVFFWLAALGGNFQELLLPDLLAVRPKRTMFTAYILASAGLATGTVAVFASLFARRGKA